MRGGRQSLHCRNIMKGVSRLSTRLVKMIKILYQLSDKCKKKNIWIGSLIYKLSKLFLNILYPIVAFFNTGYGLNDKSKIIVSLTTFPERIHTVWITVASLLNQDMKPRKVILWLAEEQFPDKRLPYSLVRLKRRGLEIKFCDDLKPHKKYFYTIQENPEAIVVTADDDILYPENHLKELYDGHKKNPDCIVCTWAHTIECNKTGFANYCEWENTIEQTPSYKILPIGCNGVLYPPSSLSLEVFNKDKLKELSLYTDDLWLKCMALLRGTKSVRYYSCDLIYFNLILTQFNGLWKRNAKGENRNDKVWKALMNEYPIASEQLFAECARSE